MSSEPQIRNHAAFIWSVADKLRGVYKQSEYGRVILPLVVLRRLDCVLEPTKADVLARAMTLKGRVENVAPVLESVAGEQFYNTSPLDFRRLLDDPANVAGNLRSYIAGFSPAARDVIEKFGFDAQISKLERAKLLYLVVSQFAEVGLHPEKVSNLEMGYLYEELVRKFSELSNETAGEHFTPREVIHLMVNLLFVEDEDVLTKRGIVKTLFDPACGTGGMLSVAEEHLRALNPDARLEVFGEELNEETYAVCRSDMMLKGQDATHIVQGNSFDDDGHAGRTFDYMLANPPFGVEWRSVERTVKDEHAQLGFRGRFGAGLPPINDGTFLFLQHMVSKMTPAEQGGSRVAIVFNGSPLFTGAAGSGPSEIRRWIIENDWLEAVVALPDQLFYNTGISTYFWVVTNRKSAERRGKVQLVDAREHRQLERDYLFARALLSTIRDESAQALDLGSEVELTHLKIAQTFEGSGSLEEGGGEVIAIFSGKGPQHDAENEQLSKIVDVVNERFGLELGDADQLLFDQFEESWAADEQLAARARTNTFENFRLVFDREFIDTVVRRMDDNEAIFKRILDEPAFQQTILDHYAERLYGRLRAENDQLGLSEAP